MGDSLWNKAPSPFRYVSAKDTDRQRREQLQSEMRKGEDPLDAMGSFVAKKDITGTFGKIWLYLSMNFPFTSHPHPTPLGCHRALDLSAMNHTANSHWLSTLHMVMHVSMLLCPFIPGSPSPLCPQVYFLCQHLLCCPVNRTISTIFLTYFTWYHRI